MLNSDRKLRSNCHWNKILIGLLRILGHEEAVSSDITQQVKNRMNTLNCPVRSSQLFWWRWKLKPVCDQKRCRWVQTDTNLPSSKFSNYELHHCNVHFPIGWEGTFEPYTVGGLWSVHWTGRADLWIKKKHWQLHVWIITLSCMFINETMMSCLYLWRDRFLSEGRFQVQRSGGEI